MSRSFGESGAREECKRPCSSESSCTAFCSYGSATVWSGTSRCRRRPTLPRSRDRSTIGAVGLNDRVRNGNGCGPDARVASKWNGGLVGWWIGRSQSTYRPIHQYETHGSSWDSHCFPTGVLCLVRILEKAC